MKVSKRTRSNLLNALIIVLTLGMVLYLSAKNGDMGEAWREMWSADGRWILAALGSWGVFMVFEAMGLHVFFRQQKVRVKYRHTFLVALIGVFYSSVTPAATGGQPMQVFALKKRGVPTGVSSSGLAVKFFCFQMALLSMGGILWVLNPEVVRVCIDQGKWVVITGYLLNGLSVVAVILLAINKNIVRGIITLAIKLGKLVRLVKDEARTASKADAAMNDFHASVDMLTHHPIQLFKLFIVSCIQMLGLMSIAYCVYRALGMREYSYFEILTLQFLLYIGASFTPLPGASGAQEGGFALFFGHVFPEVTRLTAALLLWRFFTYYLTLIVGMGGIIVDSAWNIRRAKKMAEEEAAEYPAAADEIRLEDEENETTDLPADDPAAAALLRAGGQEQGQDGSEAAQGAQAEADRGEV